MADTAALMETKRRQHVMRKRREALERITANCRDATVKFDCSGLLKRVSAVYPYKLLVPRTHNKLGDRSFSAAGPRLWNDLPPGLRRPGLVGAKSGD